MLDVNRLYRELRNYEETREKVIQTSIRVTRLSKSVIYSLIRGDVEAAQRHLKDMEAVAAELKELIVKYPMFYNNGAQGLQEYVEAYSLWIFLKERRLPTLEEVGVDVMTYLMGIADIAGELGRKINEELVKKNVEVAEELKAAVERLYLDMLSLEPRDFELRKKVDYISNQANWISEKLFYAATCRQVHEAGGSNNEKA
ncbi:MAG: haloacid dehalogenase [Thermoproteus sp.]